MDYFKKKPAKKITLDDGSEHYIKKLSQAEVEVMQKQYAKEDKAVQGLRYVVSKCVVDPDGKRVFNDSDFDKLADVDFDTLSQLAGEITDHSGLKEPKKA